MIKRGSKIKVVKMDTAGGMDWQAKRLEGKIFTVWEKGHEPFFFSAACLIFTPINRNLTA